MARNVVPCLHSMDQHALQLVLRFKGFSIACTTSSTIPEMLVLQRTAWVAFGAYNSEQGYGCCAEPGR